MNIVEPIKVEVNLAREFDDAQNQNSQENEDRI